MRTLILTACVACLAWPAAADNVRYAASASIEAQDPTFPTVAGGQFNNNPVVFGDPPAPGGVSATISGDETNPNGSFDAAANGAIDTAVPAGAPPILRADAAGSIDLTTTGNLVFGHRVSGSASWGFDITVAGPGGTVYMVPIFNINGSLTGSGSALRGGAAVTANVVGEGFNTLAEFPVPTDGSTDSINTASAALGVPLAGGATERIIFGLDVVLDLVPFAGVTTPYSASANGNFSSSAQLASLQFFADPALTDDISDQVTVTGDAAVDLQALVVPEPASVMVLGIGGAVALARRRRPCTGVYGRRRVRSERQRR